MNEDVPVDEVEAPMDAKRIIAAALLLDWLAERASQLNTKAGALLALRQRMNQADLARIAYSVSRDEDPIEVIRAIASEPEVRHGAVAVASEGKTT